MTDESTNTDEPDDEQQQETPPAPDRYADDDRRDIDVTLTGVRMPEFPPETAGSLARDILLTIRGEYGISAAGVEIDHPNADVRWFYDGGPGTVDWHDRDQRVEYHLRSAHDDHESAE